MANAPLNKTSSFLKEESCVIRHVRGWLFFLLEHLVLAVLGDELEARWAAPVHQPGLRPSQGLHSCEASPAHSTVMEPEPNEFPALGSKGSYSGGNQLSLNLH